LSIIDWLCPQAGHGTKYSRLSDPSYALSISDPSAVGEQVRISLRLCLNVARRFLVSEIGLPSGPALPG